MNRHENRDRLLQYFLDNPGKEFKRSQLMEALDKPHTTIYQNIRQVNNANFGYKIKSKEKKDNYFGRFCVYYYLVQEGEVKKQ